MGDVLWLGLGVAILAYLAFIAVLVATGRRADARALAGFVPDCVVLLRRLMADPRVSRRHKWLLAGAIAYLVLPFDVVPDFIPVVGQLDDALVVALMLRAVLRSAGPTAVAQHWPGPDASLRALLRLVGMRGHGAGLT
jgi:uncharacterized membrane protein YkvA (DUF1232 family)